MHKTDSPERSAPPPSNGISQPSRPPFWRDVRVLAILGQAIFLLIVALAAGFLYANVTSGMQRTGMTGSFAFLESTAGFEIGIKPIPYAPADSYWRAFQVGIVNTLLVSIIGITLATLVGIVVGVAQLAGNWLVVRLARLYVLTFRNIPLLLQLFFWYFVVFQQLLPPVRESLGLPGLVYINERGVSIPWFEPTETMGLWLLALLAGASIAGGVWYGLGRHQDATGQQSPRLLIAAGIVLVSGLAGWLVLPAAPLVPTIPAEGRFNIAGGLELKPEFSALLLGLSIYTGAFIAENVRAGIQGIPKGQTEAARALGFSPLQSMRLVILPQALRIIIPPTTNQYLNLMKNSSLAFAIAYPDLYNIARSISNLSGQAVQVVGLLMLSYLAISLLASFLMNQYNRRVRLVER